ncbi:MAG: MarR family winged helix-turn-helix transcriptional regulator [Syntrophobacteria bacterium]
MSTRDHPYPASSETETGSDRIKQFILLMRRLLQAGELYTKELNKRYRVSAPQLHCLLALHENGPLPPSRIARQIMVNSSTVTGIIDRLEQKALVRRARKSHDRRVITIELTEAGEKLARAAPSPIPQKIITGLKGLSDEEMEEIVRNLKKLTAMLDVMEKDREYHRAATDTYESHPSHFNLHNSESIDS